ncbi:MAG: hypothetical protein KAS32_07655 [Candidatus Peribacteraceae bacterium]|nr:hypothetical protein [Candidatus Peribacteraceae bacterium]
MTIKEAKNRIEHLKEIAGDDEAAHIEEDDLRDDFILYVAKRKDRIGKIAKIILTSEEVQFSRWCA